MMLHNSDLVPTLGGSLALRVSAGTWPAIGAQRGPPAPVAAENELDSEVMVEPLQFPNPPTTIPRPTIQSSLHLPHRHRELTPPPLKSPLNPVLASSAPLAHHPKSVTSPIKDPSLIPASDARDSAKQRTTRLILSGEMTRCRRRPDKRNASARTVKEMAPLKRATKSFAAKGATGPASTANQQRQSLTSRTPADCQQPVLASTYAIV